MFCKWDSDSRVNKTTYRSEIQVGASNIIQQIHFLLSTQLLAMPHNTHIQKTEFTISIKCF